MWWYQRRGSNIKGEIGCENWGESERSGWFLKHRGREAESEWERLKIHLETAYLAEAEKLFAESVGKKLKNKLNSTMRPVNSIKKWNQTNK